MHESKTKCFTSLRCFLYKLVCTNAYSCLWPCIRAAAIHGFIYVREEQQYATCLEDHECRILTRSCIFKLGAKSEECIRASMTT